MTEVRLGLIVNPIAGMGGSVGLKGTDGELAERARQLGALPVAATRAGIALSSLVELGDGLVVVTASGRMGAGAARDAGLEPVIAYETAGDETTADDTRRAALNILDEGVDLLLFVGGDGTARELLDVIGQALPVLGVPSGVKMHSALFAATPRAAGDVARRFLLAEDPHSMLEDAEIVDREWSGDDETSPKLYGVMRTPRLSFLVPGAKAAAATDDTAALRGAIRRVSGLIDDDRVTLIGPGATMQMLKRRLGFDGTVLGVDAVRDGACLETDLDERRILELIGGHAARIVVSVVGGQGFLFGRGNQQLSARVIREVGLDNVIVVSSLEKLAGLPGRCLLVDTGDEQLDREIAGHIPVFVGGSKTSMMPVRDAAEAEAA